MNFFLPFKMQGSRVENSRRILNKKSLDNEKDLESEFFAVFGAGRNAPPPTSLEKPPTAVSRIEYMMREMSQNKNRKAPLAPVRENPKSSANRPISLVEVEEQRRSRRFDDTRRSIKVRRQPSMEGYNQVYDQLPEKMKVERVRQLERGYSMETHDRPTYSEEMRRSAQMIRNR
ncbi:hypothetical protein OSTOST_08408 [Ostertagia ostertagi]